MNAEWKMDFESIKRLAASFLNDGHIKFTIGEDEQQSSDHSIQEHLAVTFHTDDGWLIKITQPYMSQTRRGQVERDGLIHLKFSEHKFNRNNIDSVFQYAFKSLLVKKRPSPTSAKNIRDMYETMTRDAVAVEGQTIDALVEKVMRFGTKMRHEDAVSMLKKALIERVQTSRQWLQ